MGIYHNLKIRTKVLGTIFLLLAIMAGIGVYGMMTANELNDGQDELYNQRLIPIELTGQSQNAFTMFRMYVYVHISTDNPVELAKVEENLSIYEKLMLDKLKSYEAIELDSEEYNLINAVKQSWNKYRPEAEKILAESRKLTPEAKANALQLTKGVAPFVQDVQEKFEVLVKNNEELALKLSVEGLAEYEKTRNFTIGIIAFAVIFGLGVGLFLSRSIANPLQKIEAVASAVASGDLSVTVDKSTGQDEIASLSRSTHVMVENLQNLIRQVSQGAQQVAAASEQISASTQQLASGTQNQAQEAQAITSLISEMANAVEQVAVSAQSAASSSQATNEATEQGRVVIERAVGGMQMANERVAFLDKSSEQIGEIIEVIDDIAGQTNLLALNAAIEAARAGEHGKGFAVVAEEVRKLAERSSQATKEIATLIKTIQKGTSEAVDAVDNSARAALEAGEAFKQIAKLVHDTSVQVSEIAAASEEQAASADTAVRSVQTIAAITEESSAASQETAASSQGLANMATDLQAAISKFQL